MSCDSEFDTTNLICSFRSFNFTCAEAFKTYAEHIALKEELYEQQIFGSPMLWIGLYVALSSLVCVIAMAADTVRGFQTRKLWFPCKAFSLNAASLTLLAVAVKLPVDLSNSMPGNTDQLAKLSGTVFVCTVMGNIMPSLGAMNEKEIVMNVTALGIFVITLLVNVSIQLKTGVIHTGLMGEYILTMFLMLILLVIFIFSVFVVPTTRKLLERKYGEKHKIASNGEFEENGVVGAERLVRGFKKYWMMAETGSPQFVMARSATCSAVGAICFMSALVLAEAEVRIYFWENCYYYYYPRDGIPLGGGNLMFLGRTSRGSHTEYKLSTLLILVIQTIGVVVGTIGPASRWFLATSFNCSKTHSVKLANVHRVDNYWIQMLVEWKERPLSLRIGSQKWKKLLHDIKNLILDACISIQRGIVVVSKAIQLVSILLSSAILSWYYSCKRSSSNDHEVAEAEHDTELELDPYVVQLENEEGLSTRILKNISDRADQLIRKAKQRKPKNLFELLGKSTGFKGVAEFDSYQVPDICPKELPNCWTLPVVTLASIAIALPNIDNHDVDRLLVSVSEGLSYVSLIGKYLNTTGDLVNSRNAGDFVWLGVELRRKWLNKDLQKMAREGKTSKENLQTLADIAEKVVTEFEDNSLNWPSNVVAANSMYRISKSILLNLPNDNSQTDEELFKQLCIMMADIIGACLTNLPRVITMKCFSSAIEKREESVQHAARLLGETEEILQVIQQHELPSLDPDQLASIDHWRVSIFSSFTNEESSLGSTDELHISVE